jgi:hypothetical protein
MSISLNIHEGTELFTCRPYASPNASLNKQLVTHTFVGDASSVCFVPFQVYKAGLVKNQVILDITFYQLVNIDVSWHNFSSKRRQLFNSNQGNIPEDFKPSSLFSR